MDSIIEFDKNEGVRYFKGSGRILVKLRLNVHFMCRQTIERANRSGTYEITFDDLNRFHSFDDEPAYKIIANGRAYVQHWFKNGELHRDNGPAAIRPTYNGKGTEYAWYWENKVCGSSEDPNEVPAKYEELKSKALMESVNYDQDMKWYKEYVPGHKVYHKAPNGSYHRTDGGPAVIEKNYMSWRKGGTFYREDDQPVVIDLREGERYVWMNKGGILHRLYGPAVIDNGSYEWYVDSANTYYGHRTGRGKTLKQQMLINHVASCVSYFEHEERTRTMGEFEGFSFSEQKSKGLEVAKRLYDLKYVEAKDYEEFKDLWVAKVDDTISQVNDLIRRLNS